MSAASLLLRKTLCVAKAFKKSVIPAIDAEQVSDGGGTTSSTKMNIDAQTLCDCCPNAVAGSVLVLSGYATRRSLHIVSCALEPLLQWHAL